MLSDGSMHTTLLLADCMLDDTRPGRGAKITRYCFSVDRDLQRHLRLKHDTCLAHKTHYCEKKVPDNLREWETKTGVVAEYIS